jgi:hypothetical protein
MAMAPTHAPVETPSHAFYRDVLELLTRAGVPFLIGGAFAFVHQTGIDKSTKDLDIFVRSVDVQRVIAACRQAGYDTDLVFSHWLAKIHSPSGFIDVIFGSGNGMAPVDDGWFEHGRPAELLGIQVQIAPVEETLWSKAYVMERERFDGADIMHILRERGSSLDWDRLLTRFGPHWPLLYTYLLFFHFVYPSEIATLPSSVLEDLSRRMGELRRAPQEERVCQGTLVSRAQYLLDIGQYGYADARLAPRGGMSAEDAIFWTWAIDHVR